MFNSNSLKDLINCLSSITKNKQEAEKIAKSVQDICVNNSLNFDKVVEELIKIIDKTPDIISVGPFVKAVVKRMDPDVYGNGNVVYVPVTQPFINDLRNKRVVVLADDTVWLNVVWGYIVNNLSIDINECEALNHSIISYMIKNDKRTFEDYKYLLKKSKTLRPYKINWEELEEKAVSEVIKWNKALDELEAVE